MPISNYPRGFARGVSLRNVPLYESFPGQVLWVDSSNGSNGNNGTFGRPFSTIDYAIGKVNANKGDQIHVKPGYTQNISAAGSIACDVAGVDIVGYGSGADRPTLTWTETAGTVLQTAADYSWTNFRFVANKLNVVTGFSVGANGFELYNCESRDSSSTLTFIILATIDNNMDRVKLVGNNFTGIGVTNDMFLSLAGTHDDVVVLDNYMAFSAIQTSVVALIKGGTTTTNFIVKYNDFATISAAGLWIDMTGTANTGVVAYNSFLSDLDQTGAEHKAGVNTTGCVNYENYFSSGVDFRAIPTSIYTDEDLT